MQNNNNAKASKVAPKGTALDPRTPSLVQPFKRLVEEGFITELRVKFTPTGFTAVGVPDSRLAGVDGASFNEGDDVALGVLAELADKANLIPRKDKKKTGGKAEQPKPEKTLVPEDFDDKVTASQFAARCAAVAQKCSGATLVGRVRTSGMFDGTSTISFSDWWKGATPAQRACSLVITKFRKEITPEQVTHRFGGLQCPFRGTAEFTVSQKDESEDEEEAHELPPAKDRSSSKSAGGSFDLPAAFGRKSASTSKASK